MFKNLKVRSKLLVGFGILMGFYIVAVVVAAVGLSSVSNGLVNFYNVPYPMTEYALQAQACTLEVRSSVLQAYASMDSDASSSIYSKIDEDVAALNEAINNLKNVYTGDARLIQEVEQRQSAVREPRAAAVEHLQAANKEMALNLIEGEYMNAAQELNNALQSVIDYASQEADQFYRSGVTTKQVCFIILFALAAVSLAISVGVVISITRGLVYPIHEIEGAIQGMAKGNLHSEVTYRSKDELGDLAESLRFVLTTLSSYIQHISSRMGSIAAGDMGVEMDMEYLGEFSSIQASGSQILSSLNGTLTQINQAAEQVSNGSGQVSAGAQALSQGAVSQASAVEELAATFDEISKHVSETAQNASQADESSQHAMQELEAGKDQMHQMAQAMQQIRETTDQIQKIINTIENIASQTNILALNAAVEAARAGVAGKGFAVVADEVRNLASKSAEASKSTATLIENTVRAVQEGVDIVSVTEASLEKIVAASEKSAGLVNQIAQASQEQASAISQATMGIDQISGVVQTNSATAQESAAAAEELSSQSQLLKSLVKKFRLKDSAAAGYEPEYAQEPSGATAYFGAGDDGKYGDELF